jgi:hypothetical protein
MADRTFATNEEIEAHKAKLRRRAMRLKGLSLINKTLELASRNPMLKSRHDEEYQQVLREEMVRRFVGGT